MVRKKAKGHKIEREQTFSLLTGDCIVGKFKRIT